MSTIGTRDRCEWGSMGCTKTPRFVVVKHKYNSAEVYTIVVCENCIEVHDRSKSDGFGADHVRSQAIVDMPIQPIQPPCRDTVVWFTRLLLAKIAATVMTAWLLVSCGSPSFLILGGDDDPAEETNAATESGQDCISDNCDDGGNPEDSGSNRDGSQESASDSIHDENVSSETASGGDSLPPIDAGDTKDACPFDSSDHHNGYDGPYTYCAPKGGSDASTYSLGMANAARASTVPPGSSPIDSAGSCPDGPYVRRAGSLRCITWVYAGAAFGRLAYGSTPTCYCPDVTSPRWD